MQTNREQFFTHNLPLQKILTFCHDLLQNFWRNNTFQISFNFSTFPRYFSTSTLNFLMIITVQFLIPLLYVCFHSSYTVVQFCKFYVNGITPFFLQLTIFYMCICKSRSFIWNSYSSVLFDYTIICISIYSINR